MPTTLSSRIMEKISRFASEYIATSWNLSGREDFPDDIWEGMAQAGLFKIGIEKSYGGSGGGYIALTEAAEALVANGYNTGIGISWLYQQIIAGFIIAGFGSSAQKKQHLPEMAKGKLTASFAVSEKQRGAHPKYMKTAAVKDGLFYTINGEKTYLTNAPIAELFIVIAVTEEGEQRGFSAFLVPRQTLGLTVGPPMKFNFLKPSPHGSIVLNGCRLPNTAIIGKEGKAYREIVVAFGEIEDIVMMGVATGAMAAQYALLFCAADGKKIIAADLPRSEQEKLRQALQAIRKVARVAAEGLDRGDVHYVSQALDFIRFAAEFQTNMDAVIRGLNLRPDERYNNLRADLSAMMALKKKIAQLRQAKRGL